MPDATPTPQAPAPTITLTQEQFAMLLAAHTNAIEAVPVPVKHSRWDTFFHALPGLAVFGLSVYGISQGKDISHSKAAQITNQSLDILKLMFPQQP